MFCKPCKRAYSVHGPSLGASIFCFIKTSPTQAGRPYANRVHGGEGMQKRHPPKKGDTKGESPGWSLRPSEWHRTQEQGRADFMVQLFFSFWTRRRLHAHVVRTDGQTTMTWPREIAWVMQDLLHVSLQSRNDKKNVNRVQISGRVWKTI